MTRRRSPSDLPEPDVLDLWQRHSVGPRLQLLVPLRSKSDLRRVGIILRELALRLEALSRERAADDFAALMRAKVEGQAAKDRLASHPKSDEGKGHREKLHMSSADTGSNSSVA